MWRALPAGPLQGIDSGFPSPSHPRRKAGGMAKLCAPDECAAVDTDEFACEGLGVLHILE